MPRHLINGELPLVRIYLKVVAAALVAFIVFGLITPELISSRDSILCGIGLLLVALSPVYMFLVGKHLYKSIVSLFKKVTDSEI